MAQPMTSLHKNLKHLAAFYGVPKGQIEQFIGDVEGAFKEAGYIRTIDLSMPSVTNYDPTAKSAKSRPTLYVDARGIATNGERAAGVE